MGKKQREKPSSKKKMRMPRLKSFFLGVGVGLTLFYLPIGEFSPIHFSKSEFNTQSFNSAFTTHLPVTSPLIQRENYILAYNGQTRNPYWVYHQLTVENEKHRLNRKECEFREDVLIPEHIRATKGDYQGSGFDRGHLCPAADCQSQKSLEESFILSNIVPQRPELNRGYWKKIENHVRSLTTQYPVVHAFAGPLYLSHKEKNGKRFVKYEVIGKHDVAVPTHFFMLIFVEQEKGKMLGKGYIVPNKHIDQKVSLKKFSTSVEEVEKASGIVFTKILG